MHFDWFRYFTSRERYNKRSWSFGNRYGRKVITAILRDQNESLIFLNMNVIKAIADKRINFDNNLDIYKEIYGIISEQEKWFIISLNSYFLLNIWNYELLIFRRNNPY